VANEQLYPLSTTDGESIPLDVISPIELWIFTLAPTVATAIEVLTSLNCLLSVKCSADAVLRFGATAAIYPVNGDKVLDSVYIPANTLILIKPTSLSFSLVSAAGGTAWVQVMQKWAALAPAILYDRR
jgi:hypothetical protein